MHPLPHSNEVKTGRNQEWRRGEDEWNNEGPRGRGGDLGVILGLGG